MNFIIQKKHPMFNRLTKLGTAFLFLGILTFNACQKEDIVLSEDNFTFGNPLFANIDPLHGPRPGGDCFDLVFPLEVVKPNGDTIQLDSLRQFRRFMDVFKGERNPNRRPKLVFPINVTLADGGTKTLTEPKDFLELLKSCRPDTAIHKPCYELVFPLQVKIPDSAAVTVNNARELAAIMLKWKRKHPGADKRPELVFPITITNSDGKVVTVNSAEGLKRVHEACRDKRRPDGPGNGPGNGNGNGNGPNLDKGCFRVVFPDTILFPNGKTAIAQNNEEFLRLSAKYKKDNPRDRGVTIVKLPFNIIFSNKTTATISKPTDLLRAGKECKD
jgi:hypothetical protein